jgi:hypothetical protein
MYLSWIVCYHELFATRTTPATPTVAAPMNDSTSFVRSKILLQNLNGAEEHLVLPETGEHDSELEGYQLRAAVLGACDGIVTVGALLTGVAAANASQQQLLLSACAAMTSGAPQSLCADTSLKIL